MDETRTKKVARARSRRRPASRRWLWLTLVAVMLVAAGALALAVRGQESPQLGMLMPERTTHDFGEARIDGGLMAASIPLSVDGPVQVINIATT